MLVAVMKEIPCTFQPFSNCCYKHVFRGGGGNLNMNEMLKRMGKVIKGEFPINLFYEETAPLHPSQYDLVQSTGLQCSFVFQFIIR